MSSIESPNVGDTVWQAEAQGLTVRAIVSEQNDEGYSCVLEFSRDSETIDCWEAPSFEEHQDSFAFGSWFDGSALPVWWGDIDGDGKIELLASSPKGDISPTIFRIFRWTGDDLLFLKKRVLLESERNQFKWSLIDQSFDDARWIETFEKGQAEVLAYRNNEVKAELRQVELSGQGFRLLN